MLALALLFTVDPVEWFDPAEAEKLFFQETNEARAEEGLDSLIYDSLLSRAARAHSEEMARLNYQSHISPVKKNRTLKMRLANAGFDTTGAYCLGENIAKIWRSVYGISGASAIARHFFYQGLAEEAVEGFLSSPGHRKNMLSRDYTRLGVGVAIRHDGEDIWIYLTQVSGGNRPKPRKIPPCPQACRGFGRALAVIISSCGYSFPRASHQGMSAARR